MYAIIGQVVLGWLLADLITGMFHWWEDRVGSCDMPIIGRAVIVPNRRHHLEPLAFTRSSTLSRNLSVWVSTAVISTAWFLILGPSVLWAVTTLGALVSNEIHHHAHVPARNGRVMRVLQQIGVLQSPPHHAGHHREQDRRYCVLTNWLNPILDELRVWFALERALVAIGLSPNLGAR